MENENIRRINDIKNKISNITQKINESNEMGHENESSFYFVGFRKNNSIAVMKNIYFSEDLSSLEKEIKNIFREGINLEMEYAEIEIKKININDDISGITNIILQYAASSSIKARILTM